MARFAVFTAMALAIVPGTSELRGDGAYTFQRIVNTIGTVESLGVPSINRCGKVAGTVVVESNQMLGRYAVYHGDETGHALVLDTSGPSKGVNQRVVLSDASDVVFWNHADGQAAIYLKNLVTAGLWQIAAEGDVFTTLTAYGDPCVNANGLVAFGAAKGPTLRGLYVSDGENTTPIAETASPGKFYHTPDINDEGRVAYRCTYPSGDVAIYLSRPGPDELIAYSAFDPWVSLSYPSVNDNGIVAFVATADYGAGLVKGVYHGSNGDVIPIVETGGPFASFGEAVSINNFGGVVFSATLTDGTKGLFTGYDPVAHRVIAVGDELDGSTLVNLRFRSSRGINDRGQIVFRAQLADGRSGIYRADPPGGNCPGDLDHDGYVGQADLGILMAYMGVSAGGDTNCDGFTDQSDLGVVLEAYETSCP